MKRKNKIDFICIGAHKSGTTWLYERLNEVPGINLPYKKELHFFDRDTKYESPNDLAVPQLYKRLLDRKWRKNTFSQLAHTWKRRSRSEFYWKLKWFFGNYNEVWYESLFQNLEGITGDITPAYSMLSLEDIKKIKELLPDVKIIFLVRNPIERAWSHFRSTFTNKIHINRTKKLDDFTNDDLIKFMNGSGQELRSDYLNIFKNYSKFFDSNNILIGFYDSIIEKPNELFSDILTFLGYDSTKIKNEINYQATTNVSLKSATPEKVQQFLINKYQSDIEQLAKEYGGYFNKWLTEINPSDTSKLDSKHNFSSTFQLNGTKKT